LEEPFIIHNIGTKAERKRWVLELLDKVSLPHSAANRYPHEFSGGQRQRIGIARAIALQPKLLVCDESVSALDVSVQAQILNLLLQIQKEMNLSIIFISHDLSVVKHISDRVAVMEKGKIIEMGEAKEIYTNPKEEYTKTLLAAIPITHPSQRRRTEYMEAAAAGR
jgi:ABC-type oligopeptide transport system ATPase subunit